jgi:hypothetical protein
MRTAAGVYRMDDIIIDGRTAHAMPWNPYAFGHRINHCPKGVLANVLQVRGFWKY